MANAFSVTDRRAVKLIRQTIDELQLSLEGLNILTEAGSNSYIYTPVIPLLANAKQVHAFVQDSSYGSADEIAHNCMVLAAQLQLQDRLHIHKNTLPESIWPTVDIVTNSGMLRPLAESKLSLLKNEAVIPLMYEAWELRSEDVDVSYCKKKGIKIAGTWENHPRLKVFEFVGSLAIKMLLEAECEILDNNIFVWSDDEFGKTIKKHLIKAGAKNCHLSNDKNLLQTELEFIDVIFIADYKETRSYASVNAPFNILEVLDSNPAIKIVHLYGDIPFASLDKRFQQNIYPPKIGKPQQMTHTLDHVGLLPFIRLQTGGFKVAEELFYNRTTSLSQPL